MLRFFLAVEFEVEGLTVWSEVKPNPPACEVGFFAIAVNQGGLDGCLSP